MSSKSSFARVSPSQQMGGTPSSSHREQMQSGISAMDVTQPTSKPRNPSLIDDLGFEPKNRPGLMPWHHPMR